MHIVLSIHRDYVAWRVSDGRTGSDPNMGPNKHGPTIVAILHRVGAISEHGVTDGWTFEIL